MTDKTLIAGLGVLVSLGTLASAIIDYVTSDDNDNQKKLESKSEK